MEKKKRRKKKEPIFVDPILSYMRGLHAVEKILLFIIKDPCHSLALVTNHIREVHTPLYEKKVYRLIFFFSFSFFSLSFLFPQQRVQCISIALNDFLLFNLRSKPMQLDRQSQKIIIARVCVCVCGSKVFGAWTKLDLNQTSILLLEPRAPLRRHVSARSRTRDRSSVSTRLSINHIFRGFLLEGRGLFEPSAGIHT